MFGSKKRHTPSAERKIGLTAIKYYFRGLLVAAVYIYFFSVQPINEAFKATQGLFFPGALVADYERNMSDDPKSYPIYEKQGNFTQSDDLMKMVIEMDDIFYRPVFAKKAQAVIKAWERRNGKDWYEHPSFKKFEPISEPSEEPLRKISLGFTNVILTFQDDQLRNGQCYGKLSYATPVIGNCDTANEEGFFKAMTEKIYNGRKFTFWVNVPATSDNWLVLRSWEGSSFVEVFFNKTLGTLHIREQVEWEKNNPEAHSKLLKKLSALDVKYFEFMDFEDVLNNIFYKKWESLRFIALGAGLILLFIYILIGNKYSFIQTPPFFPNDFYFLSVPFFVLYVFLFLNKEPAESSSIWAVFFAIVLPFLFVVFPILKLGIQEYYKEHPFYRRLTIWGRGGEASRLAGLREFIHKDMGNFFSRNRNGIQREETSKIYLGKTYFENDLKMGGRHIGMVNSEQHMITFAETGAGKSRDAVWNTLLSYSGGLVAFDPKGEHVRITYKRRSEYGPVHVLDPYGVVSDIVKTAYWNPLEEIDPKSLSARDELKNLAEASIFIDKHEGGTNSHFSDNAQIIYRGFLAYVVSTFPLEQRHLGTVYDLIKTGDPVGKTYSPKNMMDLIIKMLTCKGISNAARDGADILNKVGERERGSYFSTIARGIDWINSAAVRDIITKKSTFSIRDAKSKEASIYFVLPEKFIKSQTRFLRTLYSLAFDLCDNYSTPQPKDSERRTLFLFDEFYQLGTFDIAEKAVLTKRSSYLKLWFIMQNLGQLEELYGTSSNFTGSCDKQFFGVDTMDGKTLNFIGEALGVYTEKDKQGRDGETRYQEFKRHVLSRSDLAELLDIKSDGQVVIPSEGKPLILKRVPYYKNYNSSQYGERIF